MPALQHRPQALSNVLLGRGARYMRQATSVKLTIGIRREDPTRVWERRCPLTPDVVEDLIHTHNVDVLIQDCDRRVFPVDQFVKVGAKVRPTLDTAHIVLGIKETPLDELLVSPLPTPRPPGTAPTAPVVPRTHLMFSHTTKGQSYNMELLSGFLSQGPSRHLLPRLIDYELLTGTDGKRTVGFGWFAGVAGVLESLSAMAQAHLELGIASPFLHTPRPHTHASLPSLRAALQAIGEEIIGHGTPKSLGPLVVGLTGNGKVSQGALSILAELPITKIHVQDLPALVSDPEPDLRKVYLVHVKPEEYLLRVDGGRYDRHDYYQNPSLYQSHFASTVAPYLTLFLNGVGWLPGFPRLMTNDQLTTALARAVEMGRGRFGTIGDISCDVGGGLEFMPRASTISEPFFWHRPSTLPAHLPNVQIMSVDILPSTLPLEASQHFCRVLTPYLETLIKDYRGEPTEEDNIRALNVATIARGGELQGKHTKLKEAVEKWRSATIQPKGTQEKKKVLMLGSGMVAGPAIQEICKRSDIELLVASNSKLEAESLTRNIPNASLCSVDVTDGQKVSGLIKGADVVISLLPVSFHPSIAQLCIRHRKHMVTASYISADMRALHDRAEAAGVLLLNEIGLDPGIDHCSAFSLLAQLKKEKKRVLSFISFCGGLPSPEVADVPLGYKFSWSPRGVLSATLNEATFKLHGEIVKLPGEKILSNYFPDVPISSVLKLEGIANRDSLPYAVTYGLGDVRELRSVLRGTLRYPGFSDLMHSFKMIGMLEQEPTSGMRLRSWLDFPRAVCEMKIKQRINPHDLGALQWGLSLTLPDQQVENVMQALHWLVLSPRPEQLPPLPKTALAPIDLLTILLAHRLKYQPGERDLVLLSHEIVTESDIPGHPHEVHTSSLVAYGTATGSAMSKCVGLPVAFAALAVLDGKVVKRGVQGPTEEALYRAILDGLESVGLKMKENVSKRPSMEANLSRGLQNQRLEIHNMQIH
ncbi:Saccharopine dehydrogenase-domain-containing protein [Phlebopus sp. FC_14]|nr:Saccharopine dehydrogenase-domain-containing protein [Phlebopus sp. FC_14]